MLALANHQIGDNQSNDEAEQAPFDNLFSVAICHR
jgi:hypothetical protein